MVATILSGVHTQKYHIHIYIYSQMEVEFELLISYRGEDLKFCPLKAVKHKYVDIYLCLSIRV